LIVRLIDPMLFLSSTLSDNSLVKIALELLNTTPIDVRRALELVRMIQIDACAMDIRLRLANAFLIQGQTHEAERIISKIDAVAYVQYAPSSSSINLLFSVLIRTDRLNEVVFLLESGILAKCFDEVENMEWKLRVATALLDQNQRNKAENLLFAIDVDNAYTEDTKLQNIFSRIGWLRFIRSKDLAYEKAIPCFKKDQRLGRLTGQWQKNYAHALAAIGREDEAEHVVEDAYEKDKTLNNGFAVCGWIRYFISEYAPEKALQWFERDITLGRFKNFSHYYAIILGSLGELFFASAHIKKNYATDAQAHSAYSSLGWHYYAIRKNNPEKALLFFEQDQKLDRFRPFYVGSRFAALQVLLGNRQGAEHLVVDFYDKDLRANGFNLFVGLCDYSRNQDIDYLRLMCEQDDRIGRLYRSEQAYLFAAVLFKSGQPEKAVKILQKVANRSSLSQSISRAMLIGNFPSGKKLADTFITPELNNIFNNFFPKTE
jgi:hypothetical protein